MSNIMHIPVLLQEVIDILQPIKNGVFIDATFGAGGYSKAILEQGAQMLYAIDQDPDVYEYSLKIKENFSSKFHFINTNFSDLENLLNQGKIELADGIIFDLGVSSMQLDEGDRGFSFSKLANLDMRMSKQGFSARDFINQSSEEEIADVIFKFGDERYSRRIAKLILSERKKSLINTTLELAEIVRKSIPFKGRGKIDPATKTFQAIRIFVNKELEVLEKALSQVANILKPNGKLIVVSFHSLEDRIVKQFLKENSMPKIASSKYKNIKNNNNYKFVILNKKVISPSKEEIDSNIRSRSAKIRAAIRTNSAGEEQC